MYALQAHAYQELILLKKGIDPVVTSEILPEKYAKRPKAREIGDFPRSGLQLVDELSVSVFTSGLNRWHVKWGLSRSSSV